MWRYLKANCGNALPRQLIFFDCETLPAMIGDSSVRCHKLRLGCATRGVWEKGKLTRAVDFSFTRPMEFWDFAFDFARSKVKTWIVAHSLCFDLAAVEFWRLWDDQLVTDEKPPADSGGQQAGQQAGRRTSAVVLQDPPTILSMRHADSGAKFVLVDTLNYFRCPLKALGEACGLPEANTPYRLIASLAARICFLRGFCHAQK